MWPRTNEVPHFVRNDGLPARPRRLDELHVWRGRRAWAPSNPLPQRWRDGSGGRRGQLGRPWRGHHERSRSRRTNREPQKINGILERTPLLAYADRCCRDLGSVCVRVGSADAPGTPCGARQSGRVEDATSNLLIPTFEWTWHWHWHWHTARPERSDHAALTLRCGERVNDAHILSPPWQISTSLDR